jgi:hypothetical protein
VPPQAVEVMHGPDLFVRTIGRRVGDGHLRDRRQWRPAIVALGRCGCGIPLLYSASSEDCAGQVAEALDQRQAGHGATVVTVAGQA